MQKKRKNIGKRLTTSAWGIEILLPFKKINWKRPWSSQMVKGKMSWFCYWNMFCTPPEPPDILRQHFQKQWTALSLSCKYLDVLRRDRLIKGSPSVGLQNLCAAELPLLAVGLTWPLLWLEHFGERSTYPASPVMLTAHLSLTNPWTVDFKLLIVDMKGVS